LIPACATCGADLSPDARFCSACGAVVSASEPAVPAQERKLVTALFADVTGSTSLGERLDPERLKDIMNTYFVAMREEIEAEGGTVEKFAGDAVMAVFGAPEAHEDDPSRALRAAMRMQRRLARVNDDLRARHGIELEIRIGVNTGEAVATVDPPPGDALVAGDAINVAARLEQAAEPGQIVTSDRTARSARSFRCRSLGPLGLKGKSEPIEALVVVEEIDAPDRGIPGLQAPMVGRDRELDVLRSLFERSFAERRPHLVTVYGDPGVGKSRLVAEFLAWIEGQRPRTYLARGRCLSYGDGVTYWPFAEILKAHAQVLDSDPPDATLAKIRGAGSSLLTEDVAPDPVRATAALAYTVGIEDPSVPLHNLEPRVVRSAIHGAWRSFFSALALRGPVVIVVEDIHWADAALLDLLEEVADRTEGGVLIVCPSRPELRERRPAWGGGRRHAASISLEPLSRADSNRLIGLLLSIDDLPDSVHGAILERGEGNPFYLEEIIRHLIDAGRIVREGSRWRATADIEGVEIPDSVQSVLAARIDLLDSPDKRTLQSASVVGRVFWTGPVARLLNGEAAELTDILSRLQDRDLVLSRLGSAMAGEEEFIFKHILTRDVAYESLPRRDRSAAHALVATWLEETAGDRRSEIVELLAHHFEEAYLAAREYGGGERETDAFRRRAFEELLFAADLTVHTMAVEKSQRLARRALGLATGDLERSQALDALAEGQYQDARGDDAWTSFREAADLRLTSAPEDARAIAHLCGRAIAIPTRWPGIMRNLPPRDEVERYLELGLAHAGSDDSAELVQLLIASAFGPFAFFEDEADAAAVDAARSAGERAAAMALRLGIPTLASGALDAVSACLMSQGRYGDMLGVDERRMRLVPSLEDDPDELGDLYAVAAWSRFHVGRYAEALRCADLGVERALSVAPQFGLHCLVWRIMALFRLGRWDEMLEAHALLEHTLGDRRDDPPRPHLRAFAVAALVHEIRGDRPASDRQLVVVEAAEDAQTTRSVTGPAWIAELMARRGRFPEAREWLARLRWLEGRGQALEARCELVAAEGSWDEAAGAASEARSHAAECGLLVLPFVADRLAGRAALAGGDPAAAITPLEASSAGFDSAGARWERARTDLDLADALLALGDAAAAAARLDGAVRTFEELRSVRELARARELLARLG
jgi:class 3 adenylate cyclase/tetratricopeptide (TPR) repeat protein